MASAALNIAAAEASGTRTPDALSAAAVTLLPPASGRLSQPRASGNPSPPVEARDRRDCRIGDRLASRDADAHGDSSRRNNGAIQQVSTIDAPGVTPQS